ncbi:hypothetical protein EJW75_16980 [Escherichia coli]|nr:hypothetical protein [Escherichia coli]EFH8181832.1 hypothetical protein [Escherichia coli]EFN7530879.1 hypothetical protein [Escherichia coli]
MTLQICATLSTARSCGAFKFCFSGHGFLPNKLW